MAESSPYSESEPQKRRSTRIIQAVPLTVTGVDALGRPFQERTSSLIINCHGCRYQSKHYVLKNMWVTFEIPHNQAGHDPRTVRARVTWIQRPRTVRELFQIGVELEVAGNVWGIAFPPADWFPFPDEAATPEIPAAESSEAGPSAPPWKSEEPAPPQSAEPEEDNLRVLPLPIGADPSVQISRQISRLLAEAKQQVQSTVRESTTRAVAAETRPLLSALQNQMKDAADKSVSAAVAEHVERIQRESLQKLENDRQTSLDAMRQEWARELELHIEKARQQIDRQLAEVEGARGADFERKIETQLRLAIEKLQNLSGHLGGNAEELGSAIEQLRRNSAETAEHEMRRWHELTELRSSEMRTRLDHMEVAAARVGEQIAKETAKAQNGWKALLEADLAAARARWNEKIDRSIDEAVRKSQERIAQTSEEAAQHAQQQLQHRISIIGQAFSQVTTEAERNLGLLRESIGHETTKASSAISQLQLSLGQVDARRTEFSSLVEASSDELARRSQAIIESQSEEISRRSESAVTGMAERLQPALETAGQQTIERLSREMEQQITPQIARAAEILSRLAAGQDQAEKSLTEHRQKLWEASERGVLDSVARGKELLAEVEKEFTESARNNSAKWLGELDAKATETTHTTFESLFKSADWYEKKVQTQMQLTLEKGVDLASAGLREKAGELSGLFASELEHYTRSYVDHAHNQLQENAREVAEKAKEQMAQASDEASASFGERTQQHVREKFESLNSQTTAAFDQNAQRAEAHVVQVRAKLESDARALANEFQAALAKQTQDTVAQGKQELSVHTDLSKEALRTETASLNRQMQSTMQSHGAQALDEYKQRLETASSTWLLTTVSKLHQQSNTMVDQLADSTEKRLRAICGNIFAEMGETLRQRLAGFSVPLGGPAAKESTPSTSGSSENKPENQS